MNADECVMRNNLTMAQHSPMRRKLTHLAALSFFVIFGFIVSASLVPFRLKYLGQLNILHRLDASASVSSGITTWRQNNSTNYRRSLALESHLTLIDRKHHFIFTSKSGFYPETHPSQPYYVMIDGEGSVLQTIEYGPEDHPLSRLVNSREPTDIGREAIFFFVIPKVIIAVSSMW